MEVYQLEEKIVNLHLFPYYTDDKITESSEITGSKTIFQIYYKGKLIYGNHFQISMKVFTKFHRNLYKNMYGNKVIFEEVNHDLGLTFRYQWNSSKNLVL